MFKNRVTGSNPNRITLAMSHITFGVTLKRRNSLGSTFGMARLCRINTQTKLNIWYQTGFACVTLNIAVENVQHGDLGKFSPRRLQEQNHLSTIPQPNCVTRIIRCTMIYTWVFHFIECGDALARPSVHR